MQYQFQYLKQYMYLMRYVNVFGKFNNCVIHLYFV